MTISYMPLVGGNLVNACVGGDNPGDVIARASVAGVAGAGRPGSLKFSGLFFYSAANGVDHDNPVVTTLKIPPNILEIPSTLAAITADAPYDYSQMVPVVTVQQLGVISGFPTSLVDGSFNLWGAQAADIVVWAGVSGVNPPNPAASGVLPAAANNMYGSVDVSMYYAAGAGGALPSTLMLQLTVDWSASISN